ncbi:hypothetical protein OTU49_000014, partial [Cherax quadricarinatus]
QIVSAVQYCHQKKIIHRDLKAENLLLDSEMVIKIADFGFSNEFTPGNKLDTFCGSPPYAAPELFQGKKYDGPEVDVWSLGVILYTLVSGSLPFDGSNLKELRERVLRGKYRIPFYMSTDCENLLKKFLVLNPARRASLETIMKDRWMNIGYEDDELKPYIEPVMDYDDLKRIEILNEMGYSRAEIEESLKSQKYDDVYATYLLLGRRSSDLESDGSRSGSSLSLRNTSLTPRGQESSGAAQSPSHSHRGVHRSVSATNSKPSRRASSGGETIRAGAATSPGVGKSRVQKSNTMTTRISGSGRRSTYSYDANKASSTEKTNITNVPDSARGSQGESNVCNEAIVHTIEDSSNKTPVSPVSSNRNPFPRNHTSRSTFHSGQNRRNNNTYGGVGAPLTTQDTSALSSTSRTSFFSKLSSKFSKRPLETPPRQAASKDGRLEAELAERVTECSITEELTKSPSVNNDEQVKPRSLRFTWSMKTTSSRDPNDIMAEIRKVDHPQHHE